MTEITPILDDQCDGVTDDDKVCAPLKVLRAEFAQLRGSYYHFADKIEAKMDKMLERSNLILIALFSILGSLIVGLIILVMRK